MAGKQMLYEISARSWIRKFGEESTLVDVPQDYWKDIADQGFDYVWLMGVWETSVASIEPFCFHPDLTKRYTQANPAWSREDVLGSPYAIDDYILHPTLGKMADLEQTHRAISSAGLKLILDFVPNHFNAFSSLIKDNPSCFVQGSSDQLHTDPGTFYQHEGRIFAHGRDPYFPAWTDTIQVDYSSETAHQLMLDKLRQISKYCDGVRCDMAMLVLPDIFSNTWASVIGNTTLHFWKNAIPTIKEEKDFVFIAESYWDRETELQELGFDYTYDKKLLDLLLHNDHGGLSWHIGREDRWHDRSVKFIENHDEDRSMATFGIERSRAAAVMSATLPGMMLVFDGQIEGFKNRVPVQLALDSYELGCPCSITSLEQAVCSCQMVFYKALFKALKHNAFQGDFEHLETHLQGVYLWTWSLRSERLAVFINYSSAYQKVKFAGLLKPNDILNNIEEPPYLLTHADHVEVDLPPYMSAIFNIRN